MLDKSQLGQALSERFTLETLVPTHAMTWLLESILIEDKLELRPDILKSLNDSMAVSLKKFDSFTVRQLANRVNALARKFVFGMGADSRLEALMSTVMAIIMLVDRGEHPDPESQAVLVALALMEESKAPLPDNAENGRNVVPSYSEDRWMALADRGLKVLRENGLYKLVVDAYVDDQKVARKLEEEELDPWVE